MCFMEVNPLAVFILFILTYHTFKMIGIDYQSLIEMIMNSAVKDII
jgi:hypothetical protein